MRRLFMPDQQLNDIFEIDTAYLKSIGIKGLITDMDNTLVAWSDRSIYPRLAEWFALLKEEGFKLCIVSNNSEEKGGQLASEIGIPAIWYAVKPRRKAFRRALEKMELKPEETAVVGDQLFTDVLGGNRLGLHTILVNPISEKEFIWTKFPRMLERYVLGRKRNCSSK
ncbi:MAG: YqeG family HAD IIIA-type phosphatase [Bacillota bacterium]